MNDFDKNVEDLYQYAIGIEEITQNYRPIDFVKLRHACVNAISHNEESEWKSSLSIYMEIIKNNPDCSI